MLKIVGEAAVGLGVFGSLILLMGMVTYFSSGGKDPGVLNPKFGFFAHRDFILGGSLFLLCWLLKLIIYLIDPSYPIFGPSLLWDRMSREKGFYDDSFF